MRAPRHILRPRPRPLLILRHPLLHHHDQVLRKSQIKPLNLSKPHLTNSIQVKEVDIGLAADIGTLSRLPHSVGNHSWVKEIALSARIFSSDEALHHGLVSRVLADKKTAVAQGIELARLIASKSPVAVQGTKEIINYSRDRTVAEGLKYTAVWNAAMLQTQDMKDAMLSGLQKKTPTFSKL